MEEEMSHNVAPMEFQPLSFNGDTDNGSHYMNVTPQQTPQQYVEFLPQATPEQKSHDFESYSTKATTGEGCSYRLRGNGSKQKAREADRRRRAMISERLGALQDLVPLSNEGGRSSAVSDVTDYIKYLQFQVKELSRSRLGGDSTSTPLIFLEGYGHYLLQDHVVNSPLEEMIAKLLEEDTSVAMELLQSKGLFVMPMDFAKTL